MFTKTFWIQVVLAVVLVFVLCLGYLYWLDWYTNHDQRIEVPSLEKLTLSQANTELEELDLRSKVIDSSGFNPEFPPTTIIEQNPKAGKFVKENRQIYLKVNPSGYGMVTVPNVIYKTKRQAIPTLQSLGFEIGEITYKPNYAEDTVLEMRYKGEVLESGTQLRKTSVIDLVLADGKRPVTTPEDSK
ncbi:PASTA domain-containing protein [Nonlabens tegetincola]|uniref:PASTA domain-containing protein n=1 Tax=Nonlabens tegetincola TaxID=323273 RepID=UPI001FD4E7DD|nr:PASTA domain-containing protein [Nonlabens tegetincola]